MPQKNVRDTVLQGVQRAATQQAQRRLGSVLAPVPMTGTPGFNPYATDPRELYGLDYSTASPTGEPTSEAEQVGGAQKKPGLAKRLLGGLSDPRARLFMLTMANALTAPRAFGQTGANQAIGSLTQGYNSLALYRMMQQQEGEKARAENRAERALAVTERGGGAQVKVAEAGIETDKARTALEARKVTVEEGMAIFDKDLGTKKLNEVVTARQEEAKQAKASLDVEKEKLALLRTQVGTETFQKSKELLIRKMEADTNRMEAIARAGLLRKQAAELKGSKDPTKLGQLYVSAYKGYLASAMPGDKEAEAKADTFAKEIVRSATGEEVSGVPEPLAGRPAPGAKAAPVAPDVGRESLVDKSGNTWTLQSNGQWEKTSSAIPRMKGMPGPGTY